MSGGFRFYVILTIVVFTAFFVLLTGQLHLFLLFAVPILFGYGLLTFFRRTRPELPPPPLPAPPLLEPAELEGRIDRMTVEDIEAPQEESGGWSKPRYNSVLVIIISGIRYRLDPAPARRGAYDWMKEGMWVKATFDRQSRVIYEIQMGSGPRRYGEG